MTDIERLALAQEVYTKCYEATTTFENSLGALTLYLLGAILKDTVIELRADDRAYFTQLFGADHPIQRFIVDEEEEHD